jgi:acetolactate synthase-1/2/3 large subunit
MGELAAGHLAVRTLKAAGCEHLFTLSGGHIFPFYDGARHEGVSLVDTRDERTAVFAAEGMAKLTRRPQPAAVTAGPGVTNAAGPVASAQAGGSPLVVLGGRAPQANWGRGSLQELDHVPFMAPLTKHVATATDPGEVAGEVATAVSAAATPHRGPAFVDVPLDVIFAPADEASVPNPPRPAASEMDGDALTAAAEALAAADRPLLVAGTDVWLGGAWQALRSLAETVQAPVIQNGMGRGCMPADHELVFSRARGTALSEADLVVVVGTPMDFRLGFGAFGDAGVIHVVDAPERLAGHVELTAGVAGDLAVAMEGLAHAAGGPTGERADARREWLATLGRAEAGKRGEDADVLSAETAPIHPARVLGDLSAALDRDAVVIGDGGDFVSFAGKYLDSYTPGCWLDPGPFGCLGTGVGYAAAARLARPSAQVALLLGDGAAGFSLMDVDTLVRHRLPVVMVVGNNGMWALEKYPMQQVYGGWDAAADLQPGLAYDEVVAALGGAGETIEKPGELTAALERGFEAGVPYLVNVLTDPAVAYPRQAALG